MRRSFIFFIVTFALITSSLFVQSNASEFVDDSDRRISVDVNGRIGSIANEKQPPTPENNVIASSTPNQTTLPRTGTLNQNYLIVWGLLIVMTGWIFISLNQKRNSTADLK